MKKEKIKYFIKQMKVQKHKNAIKDRLAYKIFLN